MEWGLKFMSSIKDIGLRRLYKFIIKRVLGRYLSEELHLSQVEVNTGEGIVRLTQISLDCDVLNEELNNLLVEKESSASSTAKSPPVHIAAVNIRELTAHISYSTLLTESCHFIASGVEITITPTDRSSPSTVHSQDSNGASVETKKVSNDNNYTLPADNNLFASAQSEDGQKGLSFIANWIEIVIARLHVSITDLDVIVRSHRGDDASSSSGSNDSDDGGISSGIHARLSLRDIRFFNSSEFSSGSSVSDSMLLSESLTNNTSPTSSKMTILSLSAKKTVFIASLRLELCRPALPEPSSITTTTTTTTTVLSLDKEMCVNVKIDHRSADVSEGVDVDVSVPECDFHVTAADVKDISVLLFAYDILKKDGPHSNSDIPKDSKKSGTKTSLSDLRKSLLSRVLKSDPTMRALLWLAEYGKEIDSDAEHVDDAIDYSRVVQLMQDIHQGKGSGGGGMTELRRAGDFSSLLSMSTKIVAEPESDEDFTRDDDRDVDSDYDVEDDSDAQKSGDKSSRSLMKSTFSQSTMQTIHSTMFQSTRDMPSALLNVSSSARQAGSKPSGFFRLRLHVLSIMASIVDTSELTDDNEYNALCLSINDAVIVFNSTVYTDQSTNEVLNTANKVALSFNDVNLFEGLSDAGVVSPAGSRRPLLNFYQIPQLNTVYSSPHCEISVDITNDRAATNTACSQITVSVKLEPIIVSVVYRYLLRWLETLSGFVVNVSADESSSSISFTVSVSNIDVIVHPDIDTPTHVWNDLLLALDLESELGIDNQFESSSGHSKKHFDSSNEQSQSRWQPMGKMKTAEKGRHGLPQNQNSFIYQLQRHLSGSRAGFRIQWKDLCVRCKSLSGTMTDRKHSSAEQLSEGEATQLIVSSFIAFPHHRPPPQPLLPQSSCDVYSSEDRHRYLETVILTASANENLDRKVSLSKKMKSAAQSSDSSNAYIHGGSDNTASIGPSEPHVETHNIININAYRIDADVRQREYNTALIIAETIVPCISTAVPKATESSSSKLQSSIGLKLSSKFATICISEDESKVNASDKMLSKAAILNLLQRFLQLHALSAHTELPIFSTPDFQSLSSFRKELKEVDPVSLCMSVHEPLITLLSVKSEIFLSLAADDVNMYEMNTKQFNTLCKEQFQFSKPTSIAELRVGPDSYKIPFIHRAFVRNFGAAEKQQRSSAPSSFGSYSTLLGKNNKASEYAFEARLLMTSSLRNRGELGNDEIFKTVDFSIDLNDMLMSHDPKSSWLMKAVKILTPQSSMKMRQQNRDDVIEMQLKMLSHAFRKDQKMCVLLSSDLAYQAADSCNEEYLWCESEDDVLSELAEPVRRSSLPPLFEITNINIRLRDCLLMYCCGPMSAASVGSEGSRSLLSIGSLTMFSNIASNCDRFNLKFTVHDLALHIKDEFTLSKRPAPLYHVDSNSSSTGSYGKSSYNACDYSNKNVGTEHVDLMTYLNSNGFIQLMVIDRVENIVAVNEDGSAEALSLSIAIGICSIHACADSLELFSKVTQRWVSEFQTVCELPPTVRQRRKRRLYIAKHGDNFKVDSSKRPPKVLKTAATEEGLEEEDYTVSPLDSDFRVRYIVNVERENPEPVQGNEDVDAQASEYYQQDDLYHQDSNLLEDYYSSAGLGGNISATLVDPGSVVSPSPVPSEHEAAWLPQYAYDDDDDEEENEVDNHFFPLEENHSGSRKDEDGDDDIDDDSIQSFSSSMYKGRKAVDHPDPQVSRSLFLLSNLTSSLYGSKVAPKPVLEEYELQEMSEDFATCEEINICIDENPSDYVRTSFSNDVNEEDDTFNSKDHGDWLVDAEEHFDPPFSHPSSRDVFNDAVGPKDNSSVASIVFDSTGRNDILPVMDSNLKPSTTINQQRPAGHSKLDDNDVDVFPLLDAEEQASWYYGTEIADVKPYYIPLVTQNEDLDDYRPAEEKQLRTKIKFKIRGSIRVRLFSGTDLTHRRAEPTAKAAPVGQSSQALTSKSVRFAPIETPRLANQGNPSTARHATENHVADNDLPREKREMLEICAKDFLVTVRLYEENSASSSEGGDVSGGGTAAMVTLLPSRRLTGTAQDLLVTFGRTFTPHNHQHESDQGVHTQSNQNLNLGRRRKVLGLWTSSEKPRDVIQPMFQLSLVGYNVDSSNTSTHTATVHHSNVVLSEEDKDKSTAVHHQDADSDTTNHSGDLEYRLYVRLLPIRCYLDDYIVSFCKRLVPPSNPPPKSTTTTAEESRTTDSRPEVTKSGQGTENLTYFQSITLASTDIKVDYRASEVNLRALQAGDYMQLLNLIPLDGLEITLRHIKINGCAGIGQCVDRILEAWVRDIYANQLYRVISGLAPMKGLSNIGSDLHDLLSLPLSHALGRPGSLMSSPHQLARMRGGKRPDLLREVRKSTYTLLRTLSRETLKASHTATKFVANAISDLASSSSADQQYYYNNNSSSNNNNRQRRNSHDTNNSNRDRSYSSSSNTHDDDSYYYDIGDDSPNVRHRGSQPVGVMDGLAQACEVVSKEVMTAVDSVIAIPVRHFYRSEEDDAAAAALRAAGGQGGDTCVNSVMKTLPRAILRPMAGLAEGLSFALLGLRNDIDPAARLEEEDIWDVKLSNELKKQSSSSRHSQRRPIQQQSHQPNPNPNPNLSSSLHQSTRYSSNNDNSKNSYKK